MDQPDELATAVPTEKHVHPGATIRRVRDERGLSLRELARRISLTPSHLSKIERGLCNPSVGTLWSISDELGLPVAALFTVDGRLAELHPAEPKPRVSLTPPAAEDAAISLPLAFAPLVDPQNRETIRLAGVEFQRLTPHDDATIEFMVVRHEKGAGDPEAYHHRGREYGLVLEGTLQVQLGFARYTLGPGWSVAFDSSNPHRVLNIGDEPAVAVWVVVGRNQS